MTFRDHFEQPTHHAAVCPSRAAEKYGGRRIHGEEVRNSGVSAEARVDKLAAGFIADGGALVLVASEAERNPDFAMKEMLTGSREALFDYGERSPFWSANEPDAGQGRADLGRR